MFLFILLTTTTTNNTKQHKLFSAPKLEGHLPKFTFMSLVTLWTLKKGQNTTPH